MGWWNKLVRDKKESEDICKVDFWSVVPGMEDVEPPVPAIKEMPEWFKDLPRENLVAGGRPETAKACPAFIDYFKQGYVLKMWTDVEVDVDQEGNYRWNTPAGDFWQFTNQGDPQFKDHIPGDPYSMIFKAICPWRIKTSPGWAVMQLPLFYHYNKDFTALPGVIWSDFHYDISQHLALYNYGTTVIPRGTPICLFVPFKRDSVKYNVGPMTEELRYATETGYRRWADVFAGGYKDLQKKILKEK